MVDLIKKNQLVYLKEKGFRERVISDFLDVITLHYLYKSSSPQRAKDILDFCNKSFSVRVKDGSIYTLLFAMEKKKLIYGKSLQVGEYTSRFYELSEKGKRAVEMYTEIHKEEVMAFVNFLKVILL